MRLRGGHSLLRLYAPHLSPMCPQTSHSAFRGASATQCSSQYSKIYVEPMWMHMPSCLNTKWQGSLVSFTQQGKQRRRAWPGPLCSCIRSHHTRLTSRGPVSSRRDFSASADVALLLMKRRLLVKREVPLLVNLLWWPHMQLHRGPGHALPPLLGLLAPLTEADQAVSSCGVQVIGLQVVRPCGLHKCL